MSTKYKLDKDGHVAVNIQRKKTSAIEIETIEVENIPEVEECENESNNPYMFYGKLMQLDDEEYDEGAPNICYQIKISSVPSPSIAEIKIKFLESMNSDINLVNADLYLVRFEEDPKDDDSIYLNDGTICKKLLDVKKAQDYNIKNGDFFQININ